MSITLQTGSADRNTPVYNEQSTTRAPGAGLLPVQRRNISYISYIEIYLISTFIVNHPIASTLAANIVKMSQINDIIVNQIGDIIFETEDFKTALKNQTFWDNVYDRSWLFRKQEAICAYTGIQMACGINSTMIFPSENPVIDDHFEFDNTDESFNSITSNPFDSLPSSLLAQENFIDDSFIILKKPLITRRKLEFEQSFSTRKKLELFYKKGFSSRIYGYSQDDINIWSTSRSKMILFNMSKIDSITDDLILEVIKGQNHITSACNIISFEIKLRRKECQQFNQLNRDLIKLESRRAALISLDEKLENTRLEVQGVFNFRFHVEKRRDLNSLNEALTYLKTNQLESSAKFDNLAISIMEKLDEIENSVVIIRKNDIKTETVDDLSTEIQRETSIYNESVSKYSKLLYSSCITYGGVISSIQGILGGKSKTDAKIRKITVLLNSRRNLDQEKINDYSLTCSTRDEIADMDGVHNNVVSGKSRNSIFEIKAKKSVSKAKLIKITPVNVSSSVIAPPEKPSAFDKKVVKSKRSIMF